MEKIVVANQIETFKEEELSRDIVHKDRERERESLNCGFLYLFSFHSRFKKCANKILSDKYIHR